MHFPYDELYLGWDSNGKKITHTMGKFFVSISQTFPMS